MLLIFCIPDAEARWHVDDGSTGETLPLRMLCMELSQMG